MVSAKIAFTIASTAVQAISAIRAGNAANSAAQYNAQVATNNATLVRQNAAANAQRQERQSRLKLGKLSANVGAAGVTLEGTPLDLFADVASEEELNRQTILQQGEVQAVGFENNAALERFRGKTAKRGGLFGAGASLLVGGASGFGSGTFDVSGSGLFGPGRGSFG